MRFHITIAIFSAILLISSCKEDRKGINPNTISNAKKKFANVNKLLVDQDKAIIESYIKRHQLDSMKVSGTGLYYMIWGESKGEIIKTGNTVEYLYKVTLLDGTLCYQSENLTPKTFTVGHGNVEYGLEQAVLLMHPGQKGKFILPPHLAYGLVGDNNRIPARSIIVYDIEMLNVRR